MPSSLAKTSRTPAIHSASPRLALPPLEVVLSRLRAVSPTFRALDTSSWLLFLAIYARLRKSNGEAVSPTQSELEAVTGLSTRTVRKHVPILLAGEILSVRRPRAKNGSTRIVYALGAVTRVALGELGARGAKVNAQKEGDSRIFELEQRVVALEERCPPTLREHVVSKGHTGAGALRDGVRESAATERRAAANDPRPKGKPAQARATDEAIGVK